NPWQTLYKNGCRPQTVHTECIDHLPGVLLRRDQLCLSVHQDPSRSILWAGDLYPGSSGPIDAGDVLWGPQYPGQVLQRLYRSTKEGLSLLDARAALIGDLSLGLGAAPMGRGHRKL